MEHESNSQICPKCQFQNTPEAITCVRCNTPLKPSTLPVPDMVDAGSITDEDDATPEAKKQKERGIALWVRNHARPILVAGGAILGRKVGEENNENLVDLTDYNGYKLGVSRRHAQIDCTGQGCLLLDLGSSNGTWINGLRLQPYQPVVLRSGDRVYLARLEIIVGPISDEALRRARHIPHGMPVPPGRSQDEEDLVPSDVKTNSLGVGQQKVTVPVEEVDKPDGPVAEPPGSPAAAAAEKPVVPAADKPTSPAASAAEKAAAPAVDKPTSPEPPTADKPVSPAVPAANATVPATEKPVAEKPVTEKPAAEKPATVIPAAEKPATAASPAPKAAEPALSDPKATIVSPPNGNGSKPAESADVQKPATPDVPPQASSDKSKADGTDEAKPDIKTGPTPDKPAD